MLPDIRSWSEPASDTSATTTYLTQEAAGFRNLTGVEVVPTFVPSAQVRVQGWCGARPHGDAVVIGLGAMGFLGNRVGGHGLLPSSRTSEGWDFLS